MRRTIALLMSAGLLTGAALLFSAGPAEAATGDLIRSWGEPGQQPGELGFIYGLALDDQNRVWVADTSNDRIQRFSGGGKFQLEVTHNMDNPEGVAVAPNRRVYVADSLNDRILVFGQGGAFKDKWGKSGSGPRRFEFPASVAVAPNGDVWVADKDNHRVSRFTGTGTLLANYEGLNLDEPNGVAVDPSGTYVYIADSADDQVVKIEASDGDFVDEWGTGDRPSMVTANEDFVYVTNGQGSPPNGSQVQKFEVDGDFITDFDGPDGMAAPCGIVLTPGGKVYVAEFTNQRVQKFEG